MNCRERCLFDVMEEDPSVFPMESDIPIEVLEESDDDIENLLNSKLLQNKWEILAHKEPD